jgi:Lrp/AsnC family transcriptional regulator
MRVDAIDRRILDELQQDAGIPVVDLADRVGLSPAPCWRRIRKLEDGGLIAGRVVLLDRNQANVPMTVFVSVRTSQHSVKWLEQFRAAISDIREIVEAWRLTGRDDYLLKIVVPGVDVYDRVYKQLIERVEFLDVSSSIAMEEMKFTTAVPTVYI